MVAIMGLNPYFPRVFFPKRKPDRNYKFVVSFIWPQHNPNLGPFAYVILKTAKWENRFYTQQTFVKHYFF